MRRNDKREPTNYVFRRFPIPAFFNEIHKGYKYATHMLIPYDDLDNDKSFLEEMWVYLFSLPLNTVQNKERKYRLEIVSLPSNQVGKDQLIAQRTFTLQICLGRKIHTHASWKRKQILSLDKVSAALKESGS